MDRITHALRTRPVRVLEALIALLAVLGVVLLPETETAVYALVAALVAAGVIGGEVVQTQTTPTVDPKVDDGHAGEGDAA